MVPSFFERRANEIIYKSTRGTTGTSEIWIEIEKKKGGKHWETNEGGTFLPGAIACPHQPRLKLERIINSINRRESCMHLNASK